MATWLRKVRGRLSDLISRHEEIPKDIREQLPLSAIDKVIFFKTDEWATDLICCEIDASGTIWFFHEEAEGWDAFISYIEELPGFHSDWYQSVVLPPFAANETVAYTRA